MACVILKKGEGRGLSAGGAWIYDNEIDRIDGDFEEGGLVAVSASNGYPLGTGYIKQEHVPMLHEWRANPSEWGK